MSRPDDVSTCYTNARFGQASRQDAPDYRWAAEGSLPARPSLQGGRKRRRSPENQLGHFREFTGAILHEFSTKIHDSLALCPVPIGRNPATM